MKLWPDNYCQFDSYCRLGIATGMAKQLNSNGVPALVYDDSMDINGLLFPVFLVLIPTSLVDEARRAMNPVTALDLL